LLEEDFMGALSIWHIAVMVLAVLLLFGGRGKVSDLMGDVAKGIKSFRAGLNEPEPTSVRRHDCAVKALADIDGARN
jgi:sec-independent protein translocase protein TatA